MSGVVEVLAGTTVEGLRDGPALDAWLAQPSGLAVDGDRLWFVDAETSALRWITADRIALSVRGGRDGGYRTYSMKTGVRSGAWRVNVETPNGAILGRFRFNVLSQSALPAPIKTELKD